MEFNYQLTPEDLAAFGRATAARPQLQRKLFMTRALYPALTVLFTGLPMLRLHRVTPMDAFWLATAVAWYLLFPRWFVRGVGRRTLASAREGSRKGATGAQSMWIDEHGVTVRNQYELHQRFWPAIERVVETPEHVFIYYGAESAVTVPKSWLGDSVADLRLALERGMRAVAAAA